MGNYAEDENAKTRRRKHEDENVKTQNDDDENKKSTMMWKHNDE